MRKRTAFLVAISLTLSTSPAFAAIKTGSTCPKKGATQTSAGKKYICVALGKKLNWKIAPTDKPAPIPQPQPTDSALTSTPTPADPAITEKSKFATVASCKLENIKGDGDQYLGFPRSAKYPSSVGDRRAIVIFVDFEDLAADNRAIDTWKKVQVPYTEKALSALSYGKYSLKFDVQEKVYRLSGSYKTVTRSDFANVPGSTPALALEYSKLIRDGVKAADQDIDFSKYDFVNIVTPTFSPKAEGGASGADGFNVDGKTSFLATVGPIDEYVGDSSKDGWLLHETGHILGLTHVYNYTKMMGAWDIMGNTFGLDELHGWQRFYLGWISDLQVDCLDETSPKETIHKIAPLSDADSQTKIVLIKLTSTTALAVEVMRKSTLNNLDEKDYGVIVYKIDTTLSGGQGSISIVSNTQENGPTKAGRGGIYGTMRPGESLSTDGITIKVISSTASGDFVSITQSK